MVAEFTAWALELYTSYIITVQVYLAQLAYESTQVILEDFNITAISSEVMSRVPSFFSGFVEFFKVGQILVLYLSAYIQSFLVSKIL